MVTKTALGNQEEQNPVPGGPDRHPGHLPAGVDRHGEQRMDIPADMLVNMADTFAVTPVYIFRSSYIRCELNDQKFMNHEKDRYYDMILHYQRL